MKIKPKAAHMLELANKDFKVAIITAQWLRGKYGYGKQKEKILAHKLLKKNQNKNARTSRSLLSNNF
jgi:hypothetical protein